MGKLVRMLVGQLDL